MSRRKRDHRAAKPATMTSPPFRMTVEEWARDTGLTVDQVREDIDALIVKGWLIPLAPDTWVLTVPQEAAAS
ncbi:hypothetical protein ACPXB1_22490 [Micromonospora sp. DT68]|uniref:hypothetical protein n=1 Tax=Micromonospora TaxID=1873 RepID=UPI0014389688|nr:hypothetical protein [Micromonospora profundi]NJC10610.1 hypothetical protein [Micromonospora profundi]